MEKMRSEEKTDMREFRFGREMQHIANRFRRLGDENLTKKGITFSQLRVLAFVSRNGEDGEVFQKDLEEHLGTRRSSVTSLVQNMEKSGLLIRCTSPKDARIKTIALTEKGKALDADLRSYIHTLEENLMQGFSSEERGVFRAFLTRILENLETIERSRI